MDGEGANPVDVLGGGGLGEAGALQRVPEKFVLSERTEPDLGELGGALVEPQPGR